MSLFKHCYIFAIVLFSVENAKRIALGEEMGFPSFFIKLTCKKYEHLICTVQITILIREALGKQLRIKIRDNNFK